MLTPDNPLHRFRAYLVSRGWWSESEDAALTKKNKSDVMKAFTRAEKLPKPKLSEMFNDVWAVKAGEEVPEVIVSDTLPLALVSVVVRVRCAFRTRSRDRRGRIQGGNAGWKGNECAYQFLTSKAQKFQILRATYGRSSDDSSARLRYFH